jgi:chromosome segregation ATPase
MGIARLENYFDPNERKYFISPKSVDQVIQEEIAKAAKAVDPSTRQEHLPKDSETEKPLTAASSEADPGRLRELEKEIIDLKITNRGKDYFIEQLQKEREGFVDERAGYVEKLMSFNRKVGELENKLLQLEGPRENSGGLMP